MRPDPKIIRGRGARGQLSVQSYRMRGHQLVDRMVNEAVREGYRVSGVHVVVMYTEREIETRAGFKADGAWDSWPEAVGCLTAAQQLALEKWRDAGGE